MPQASIDERTASEPAGDRTSALQSGALEERRVAPERVHALLGLEETLHGRLDRRPRLYGILIVVGASVGAILFGTGLGRAVAVAAGQDDLAGPAGSLGGDLAGTAFLVGLLWRRGWWREVGFGGPSTWRSLRLLAFPALLASVLAVGGIASLDLSDPARLALKLSGTLLTGFWEEGFTRGLLLSLLLVAALRGGRGPMGAVFLSAVVFGLFHLVAVPLGKELGPSLAQVATATLFGIGFGALLLRTNALWLLAGLHALGNLGSALRGRTDPSDDFQAFFLLSELVLAVYGLFLLRRVKSGDRAAAQNE
ncbi:MAG: CPBP family intramembrane glutamic endopeptidase [Thermoleophilaceae bacterium]